MKNYGTDMTYCTDIIHCKAELCAYASLHNRLKTSTFTEDFLKTIKIKYNI